MVLTIFRTKFKKLDDSRIYYILYLTYVSKNILPSEWNRIILRPIPKACKYQNIPNNSRGINLISTVAKLYRALPEYSTILIAFMETNGKFNYEQFAYIKGRSCTDNVYVLASIIRERTRRSYTGPGGGGGTRDIYWWGVCPGKKGGS